MWLAWLPFLLVGNVSIPLISLTHLPITPSCADFIPKPWFILSWLQVQLLLLHPHLHPCVWTLFLNLSMGMCHLSPCLPSWSSWCQLLCPSPSMQLHPPSSSHLGLASSILPLLLWLTSSHLITQSHPQSDGVLWSQYPCAYTLQSLKPHNDVPLRGNNWSHTTWSCHTQSCVWH